MSKQSGRRKKLGDLAAEVRAAADGVDKQTAMRRQLAEYCKSALPAKSVAPPAALVATPVGRAVPQRVGQTLEHLLSGDSEKEVAAKLGISQHTVHLYVKRLYRHYDVNSRGELLARFVGGRQAS